MGRRRLPVGDMCCTYDAPPREPGAITVPLYGHREKHSLACQRVTVQCSFDCVLVGAGAVFASNFAIHRIYGG